MKIISGKQTAVTEKASVHTEHYYVTREMIEELDYRPYNKRSDYFLIRFNPDRTLKADDETNSSVRARLDFIYAYRKTIWQNKCGELEVSKALKSPHQHAGGSALSLTENESSIR